MRLSNRNRNRCASNTTCDRDCKCSRCCPKCEETCPTGPAGPTGPSGLDGPVGLPGSTGPTGFGCDCYNQRGILEVTVPISQNVVITEAMLDNPDYPGCKYRGIRLIGVGGGSGEIVTFPLPATLSASVEFVVENRAGGSITLANGGVDSFALLHYVGAEASLEEEIANGGVDMHTYRTTIESSPDGVRRIPGFTKVE